jgi:RNA polymerase subunit RPABC4/transcription elongation factor Spt4
MSASQGKMTALVILFLLLLFFGFILTPLVLAPLGVLTGTSHGLRTVFVDGFHFRPWFPFFPAWSFSLLFLIIWIAVIVWVYRDAERRGMSGLLWALLVFIGNLIGLLIYLIVRQDHPEAASGETAAVCCDERAASAPIAKTAPSLTCPSCQKPVEKDFAFCPNCGARLQPVCPSCGRPVEVGWKVCPHCGLKLQKEV